MWHDSFTCICVIWLILMHMYMCDVTHSHAYVWHVLFACICVTKCICVTQICHIHLCALTYHIQMCDMTHSNVWHDSFKCVTWLIQMCDMTDTIVSHAFICLLHELNDSSTLHELIRIHMLDMTYTVGERVPTISHLFICMLHELKKSSKFTNSLVFTCLTWPTLSESECRQ